MKTSLDEQELLDILIGEVAELGQIPREEIGLDRPWRELGIDSLIALELVVRLERRFKIWLSDEEINSVRCINDMVTIAKRKTEALT